MGLTGLELLLVASTILEFNPFLQTIKVVKKKNLEGVSLGTFIMIFILGIMWLVYGIQLNNVPLIVGNAVKVCTSFSVICVYLYYKKQLSAVQ